MFYVHIVWCCAVRNTTNIPIFCLFSVISRFLCLACRKVLSFLAKRKIADLDKNLDVNQEIFNFYMLENQPK